MRFPGCLRRFLRPIRGFGQAGWTVVGAVVGTLTGVLLSVLAEADIGSSVTAGLAVTIIFMQGGEVIQRDRVADILGPYYKLRRDWELLQYVQDLVGYYMTAKDSDNEMISDTAREVLDAAVTELSFLAEGRLHINALEDFLVTIGLLKSCDLEMRASSWQNIVEYWTSPFGQRYLDEHKKFFERNKQRGREGKVIRVFVLEDDEVNDYKDIMLSQSKLGVDVRVARVAQENLPTDCLEGYVIYDNNAVRVESYISGIYLRSVFSIDPREVRKYHRKFDDLYLRSVPLSEVFPEAAGGASQPGASAGASQPDPAPGTSQPEPAATTSQPDPEPGTSQADSSADSSRAA